MPDFLSFINEILWGSAMVYLLIGAGIWFTWRCRFVQFLPAWRPGFTLRDSLKPQSDGLSAFQALCTSMAARAGSGNLVGVALAISAGGPGAIFWMWISALIGMATSFAECSQAQLYKERDADGRFRGGPAWYMSRGLGMRWMGVMFSLFLLIAYGLIFNTVQANSIAQALSFSFAIPKFAIGLLLATLVLLTILRGLRGDYPAGQSGSRSDGGYGRTAGAAGNDPTLWHLGSGICRHYRGPVLVQLYHRELPLRRK